MKTSQVKFFLWRTATPLSVAILTLAFLAALSGMLIGFNYQPVAGKAFDSLQRIATNLSSGTLILGLHHWAGNAMIVAGIAQIFVMFLGRVARRSWLAAWVSGFGITISAIALGWTAMILDWNQLGFWRLKVELSTLGSLPVIGQLIDTVLLGGEGIGSTALTHFYAIHSYILPIAALGFAVVHLLSLINHEQQERDLVLQQLERLVEPEVTTARPIEAAAEGDRALSQS